MTETETPPIFLSPRPAWVSALGILGVLTGSLGIARSILMLAETVRDLSDLGRYGGTASEMSFDYFLAGFAWPAVEIVAAALALTAGILLLKRRPVARGLFIGYAILSLALPVIIPALSVGYTLLGGGMNSVARADIVGAAWQLSGILAPVPVFFLAWFLQPTVAAEMRSWRR